MSWTSDEFGAGEAALLGFVARVVEQDRARALVAAGEVADGSPYRAVAGLPEPVAIATSRRRWWLDGLCAVGVIGMIASLVRGDGLMLVGCAFMTAWLGAMRVSFARGRKGVHRIDAEARGVRIRCTDAAMAQLFAVAKPRAVDLFIPWDECIAIEARAHTFGDDREIALVIVTPRRVIALRPDVFAEPPLRIAERLQAARKQLALPPSAPALTALARRRD